MVEMTNPASAPVSRRALAKQKTRERVLNAARRLFSERGYEAATVRDIAHDAGLSTGAVFASFSDKAEMFEAVLMTELAAVREAMAQPLKGATNIDETLVAMFNVVTLFHASELPFVKATLGYAWVRDADAMARVAEAFAPLRELVAQALKDAVIRGELSQNVDIQLISFSLWDLYLSDVRRMVFSDTVDIEGLIDRLRRQAEVMLAGYRR